MKEKHIILDKIRDDNDLFYDTHKLIKFGKHRHLFFSPVRFMIASLNSQIVKGSNL